MRNIKGHRYPCFHDKLNFPEHWRRKECISWKGNERDGCCVGDLVKPMQWHECPFGKCNGGLSGYRKWQEPRDRAWPEDEK